MSPVQRLLVGMLRAYQWLISPLLRWLCGPGFGCRFEPSCSSYAMEAVLRHGAWRGLGLAVRRLLRCHPWGGSGWDPVPGPSVPSGDKGPGFLPPLMNSGPGSMRVGERRGPGA